MCEPRSWELKNGKGNRITKAKLKKLENEPPSDAPRFDLKAYLYQEDRVHLGPSGFRILTEIMRWQTSDSPAEIHEMTIPIRKDGIMMDFECHARFKF